MKIQTHRKEKTSFWFKRLYFCAHFSSTYTERLYFWPSSVVQINLIKCSLELTALPSVFLDLFCFQILQNPLVHLKSI